MVDPQQGPEKHGACALGWVKAEGCLLQDWVPGAECASALFVCLFLSNSENYPGQSWKRHNKHQGKSRPPRPSDRMWLCMWKTPGGSHLGSQMPAMLPGPSSPTPYSGRVCDELGMVEADPSLLKRKGLCPEGTGEGTLEAIGPEGTSQKGWSWDRTAFAVLASPTSSLAP